VEVAAPGSADSTRGVKKKVADLSGALAALEADYERVLKRE
jgi:hypothetical protein